MELIAIAATVAIAAAFVQGAIGFGFGLVAMALLPLWMPLEVAVPTVALLGLAVNGSLFVQLRRHIGWRQVGPLLAGAAVGIPIGVAFLRAATPTALRAVLGAILLGYVALTVVRARAGRAPLEVDRRWGYAAGVASGILGGAFNTGGPPAVLYVASQPSWSPAAVKANLQALFVLTAVVQLTLFGATGLLSADVLKTAALAGLAAAFGAWLGHRASARLDRARFQRWLLVALTVLGASYLVRAVTG